MTKFTDHLWSDLAREHGATLAEADRREPGRARLLRHRGVLAGGTLGLAGAGTALAIVLGAASAPAAYAVTTTSDGSVLVTINEETALPQANAKLAAMGIHEQVTIYMASGTAGAAGPVTCTPAPGTNASGPPLEVLVGKDGTEVIAPGETGGNTGVGTWHLDHCVVFSGTGSGSSGNTGAPASSRVEHLPTAPAGPAAA
jgi:hypothetical protein